MTLAIERVKRIYNDHVKLWGFARLIGKYHEETGELNKALNKFAKNDTPENRQSVIGEIADAQIQVERLEHYFGSDAVQDSKREKLLKMEGKITREKFKRAETKRKIEDSLNEKQFKLWKIICDAGGMPTESQLNDIIVGVKIYCAPDVE